MARQNTADNGASVWTGKNCRVWKCWGIDARDWQRGSRNAQWELEETISSAVTGTMLAQVKQGYVDEPIRPPDDAPPGIVNVSITVRDLIDSAICGHIT
jgi:hypothetical protein